MRRVFAGVILVLASVGCATRQKADYFNDRGCQFYGSSFCTMAVADLVDFSHGPDSKIYNFVFDGRNVLAIFEDNMIERDDELRFERKGIGAQTVKYREYTDDQGRHRIYWNDRIGRPSTIHMIAPIDLNQRQREFVDYALATFRYCRPSSASMICK